MEALLISEAIALNAMFANLVLRAQMNMGEYLDAGDRYMRLALKAQSQCRATLETLATIKNPPTVFAKQANIAHGPQQVNNGIPLARAGNSKSEPNKLLEAYGERLDARTSDSAGASDQNLAPVGTVHRSEDCGRQGTVGPKRISRWATPQVAPASEGFGSRGACTNEESPRMDLVRGRPSGLSKDGRGSLVGAYPKKAGVSQQPPAVHSTNASSAANRC